MPRPLRSWARKLISTLHYFVTTCVESKGPKTTYQSVYSQRQHCQPTTMRYKLVCTFCAKIGVRQNRKQHIREVVPYQTGNDYPLSTIPLPPTTPRRIDRRHGKPLEQKSFLPPSPVHILSSGTQSTDTDKARAGAVVTHTKTEKFLRGLERVKGQDMHLYLQYYR